MRMSGGRLLTATRPLTIQTTARFWGMWIQRLTVFMSTLQTYPNTGLILTCMVNLPTRYMPFSSAGGMQPSMNVTIVHNMPRFIFYRSVGITLVVNFGPSSASYVIMETITSLDISISMDTLIWTARTSPQILLPIPRLLGSFCPICHLRLHLDLRRIDTLPEQL